MKVINSFVPVDHKTWKRYENRTKAILARLPIDELSDLCAFRGLSTNPSFITKKMMVNRLTLALRN